MYHMQLSEIIVTYEQEGKDIYVYSQFAFCFVFLLSHKQSETWFSSAGKKTETISLEWLYIWIELNYYEYRTNITLPTWNTQTNT